MQLIKTRNKVWRIKRLENFYIKKYQLQGLLINDKYVCDINP
jgi:hypothetical protein